LAQRNRHDRPGQRHHIYNRGIAKRVLFPDRRAKRRFLALMLCAVRRGELLLEAFSLLDTHFHILARSTDVRISYPMMRVQNAYTRYINRRLKRDGTMSRGRFGSSAVDSRRYAFTSLRYIDHNPVKAGICARASDYPFGSARVYATHDRGPAWLSRALVDDALQGFHPTLTSPAHEYRKLLGIPLTQGEAEVVERRQHGRARQDDDLDLLDGMPPDHVAAWMRRKAKLADGLSPWAPIVGSTALLAILAAEAEQLREATFRLTRKACSAGPLLTAGLLHDVAGLGCEELARTLDCAPSTAGRRLRLHRRLLVEEPEYGLLAARCVEVALKATYPFGLPV